MSCNILSVAASVPEEAELFTNPRRAKAPAVILLTTGVTAAGLFVMASVGAQTKPKAQAKPAAPKTAAAKNETVAPSGAPTPEQIAAGKKVYEGNGCSGCHAIGGKGGNAGPDLSNTGANSTHTPAWLQSQVTNPKTHTPTSTMPAYPGIKGPDLVSIGLYLSSLKPAGASSAPLIPVPVKVAPVSAAVVAKVEKLGGSVRQVAQNDNHVEIDYHMTGASVTDAALVPLATIKTTVELNLAKTSITDAGLANIKGLTGLKTLHLENTKITDKGLAHLKGLKELAYLNVYGTAVTDDGIQQLSGLANLKKLYVWQTKVTKAGADKLKAALPKLEIVLGFDAK